MLRQDYLLRLIAQAIAALQRLRERLYGGASAEEVVRDAGAAIGALLGPQRSMFDLLDAKSAAMLVGDTERLELWVSLIRLQAEAERSRGDEEAAARLETRADALMAHAAQTK